MAHPPELKERAKELRKQGVYVKVIAVDLGVPKATVIRWTNPQLEQRERRRARKLKFSEKKKCSLCKTKRVSNNSDWCFTCHRSNRRYWTRERLIEAVREWALKHGKAPSADDWQRSGPGHPARSSIMDGPDPPFKTFSALIEAAGFEPGVRRKRKKMSEQEKQRRAAIRRQTREEKIIKALKEGSNGGDPVEPATE